MSIIKGNSSVIPVLAVALVLVSAAFLPGSRAQPPEEFSPASADARITREVIEGRIEALTSSAGDEDTKTELVGLYKKVLGSLDAVEVHEAKAAGYVEALEKLPEQTKALRARLDTPVPEPEIEPLPPELSVEEVEHLHIRAQSGVAEAKAEFNRLEQILATWPQSFSRVRNRIAAVEGEIERLTGGLDRSLSEDGPPLLVEARDRVAQARQRELHAELLMLNQDLLSRPVRRALLEAQRDESAHDLRLLRVRQEYLETQLDQRRRLEAERAREAAEIAWREAADRHPLLGELTRRNAQFSAELSELAGASLAEIQTRKAQIATETERLGRELDLTRQRMEVTGLTRMFGQTLIDQRKKLPDRTPYLEEAEQRKRTAADIGLKRLRYEEELEQLEDPEAFVDALTAGREEPIPSDLRNEIRDLAQQRKALLEKVSASTGGHLRALSDWVHESNQLLAIIASYHDYLTEHILWVPNVPPIGLDTLRDLPAAVAWFFSASNWLDVTRVLVRELSSPSWAWPAILGVLLLLWRSRAMRRVILGTAAHKHVDWVEEERMGSTFEAIGLTLLLAVPWPLLLFTLGWHLNTSPEAASFTKAVGHGARSVAFALFSLQAFRLLCITGGVANRHFRWSTQALRTVKRNFDWMIWFLIPMGLVLRTIYSYGQPVYSNSLGRIALIITMLGFAFFIMRMIHPKRGVLSAYLATNPRGWMNRLSPVWYLLIIAVPLSFVVLALLGYVHTAGILLRSLIAGLWLVFGLILAHQCGMRWLTLSRQRLARRAAAAREQKAVPADSSAPALRAPEPEVDLAALDAQTRKLVNSLVVIAAVVGLWMIYSDVLPALAVFEKYSLWTYSVTLDGQEQSIPVTLADMGLILVVTLVSLVALKNLPALVDIALLQHFSISAGSRYTVNTLLGYFIIVAGGVTAFNIVGVSWSKIQWLVAAFSVGIGFGLQEIIANFVSGLIVLFEQPIRVGDVVTVRNITGTVVKIRIRATVVRNWDGQELLVPNKEFITGHLLNWTLSNPVNRIIITLEVDYEADISQAMTHLRKVVERNDRILKDPKPLITVESFGSNALTLVLRCYLDSLENRLSISSELYQNINEEFRAAGIPITGGGGKVMEG